LINLSRLLVDLAIDLGKLAIGFLLEAGQDLFEGIGEDGWLVSHIAKIVVLDFTLPFVRDLKANWIRGACDILPALRFLYGIL
jgi:hypothetical protein